MSQECTFTMVTSENHRYHRLVLVRKCDWFLL